MFKESVLAAPKEKVRRGYRTLKAVDPRDGGTWDVLLSDDSIERTCKRGMGASLELAHTVTHALLHPSAVFKGVREEAEADWLCYVCIPPHAYDWKTEGKVPRWDGEVFLVYVNYPDRAAYHWSWHPSSRDNPSLPEDHEDRFDEKVL